MAKTKHNSNPSITRSGYKFTATWKINASSVTDQDIRWRTFNGSKWSGWTTKDLGKSTKSKSFELSNTSVIKQVQVQTRTKASGKGRSSWGDSSSIYTVSAPATPTLSVSNDSANKTTFTWSSNHNDTNTAWYTRTYYSTNGVNWTSPPPTSPVSYTDTTTGTWRTFSVKNWGPAGYSSTNTEKHYIGLPPIATWQNNPVSRTNRSSYYEMTYNFNLSGSHYTVDDIVLQYFIGVPLSNMACPGSASWVDSANSFDYRDGQTAYSLPITTSDTIDTDECLWTRIKTLHDGQASYSTAYRELTGVLGTPTATFSVSTPTSAGFTVTISNISAGTQLPGAFFRVYLERKSTPGKYELIGTLANGSTSGTVTSAIDITGESGYSIHMQNVSADGSSMKSGYASYVTTMPSAPTLSGVTATNTSGKVYVAWTHNWSAATGAEIAWTDDSDNWMSNEEPSKYEVKELASGWYITGLNTGMKWYFRVRSMNDDGVNVNYSSWSDEKVIDLASAPAVSTLYLSEQAITENGMVTAYWSYATTDGTSQTAGNVVVATYDEDEDKWVYGESVGSTNTAQHIDIYAQDHGWTDGTTVHLALQTRASSGGASEYSTPVELAIVAKPTVSVDCSDLLSTDTDTEYFLGDGVTTEFLCACDLTATPTVTVDGEAVTVSSYSGGLVTLASAPAEDSEVAITYTTSDSLILDEVPFTVEVDTENAETLTVAIERAKPNPMILPDDTEVAGAIGETVYLYDGIAEEENEIEISTNGDSAAGLIGRLDDGAYYKIVATVKDRYGQKAEDSIPFKVHWSHQAWRPTATFVTDTTNYIVKITPVAGADYEAGDTCDIYRLSVDKPELIISGAAFGTQYVDPFPAFGEYSGYKVVTVTANDDYITELNEMAAYDTVDDEESTYDQLDLKTMVIDFNNQRIELPYNITLNNSWSKDFNRTVYLGGSVVGDHNATVSRDLSATTVLARDLDEDKANLMRELSNYTDICHVRTPEGSSFAADVQVTENRSHDSGVISYDLKIQKVDPVGYEGMTYEEWSRS